MTKRDVMLSVADEFRPFPYIPAAFFLHFPPEYHFGRPAVEKHLDYFRQTNMDFIKIQYERTFPPIPTIQSPSDWSKMPHYGKDFFEGQLQAVDGLIKAVHDEALVIVTLYSTFMCAGHTTNDGFVTDCLNRAPEQIRAGFEIISESLLVFVRECINLGVDGFYMSTQGGEAGRFSDKGIFEQYIKPFDLLLMNEIAANCRFNILLVCDYQRSYDDFSPFVDYPGTIVNCPLYVGNRELTPTEASQLFKRPFMGGLERKGIITSGTPDQIRDAVAQVIADAPARFVLGADCTVPSETPWQNLKTAIDAAHNHRS